MVSISAYISAILHQV